MIYWKLEALTIVISITYFRRCWEKPAPGRLERLGNLGVSFGN
jgi:hypothetical protein